MTGKVSCILTVLSAASNMFSGFRSLCDTLCRWQYMFECYINTTFKAIKMQQNANEGSEIFLRVMNNGEMPMERRVNNGEMSMREGFVLYPADDLLENFSCFVLWKLAAADYKVKQLAIRAVSGERMS